ncbi:ATP-binding cassette domain-containing protein [Anaerovorax odorimutans]|uniref:ATP-binding cassette domain-containing protein n=1 Tax=Anaerovorax odorimutans TaxID=109327 RepID=A0ABT1RSN1_9FIRM|nr:ATP-binding cassette domain-containing protein [Anaerovorax odorimutans]MCQ4638205.1 ATP-binding cassette domain-containing protein [Anaerovorax odorimutans]
MKHIIEVENLQKAYGAVRAVQGISFYVEEGGLFAFLGPNGAGKSTTIDMICTFLRPDSGTAMINGFTLGREDEQIRRSIGVVFQDSLLDQRLTVEENMYCRGALYGLRGRALAQAVDKAMDSVGVQEYGKRPYGKLSGGQRRRCDIARALINTPEILFLDEPTTGLDPQTRTVVWETIRRLQKERGMTVFLTTHYMEEAAAADYVLVIDDGKIAAKGIPVQLRETYAADRLKMVLSDEAAAAEMLSALDADYAKDSGKIIVKLGKTTDALPILDQCRPYIKSFEVTAGSMDDAFMGITGKELRE